MNFSNLIDWDFFWNCFDNLLFSVLPFALLAIVISAVGMVVKVLVNAIAQFVRR
jgi:hypothetical protein